MKRLLPGGLALCLLVTVASCVSYREPPLEESLTVFLDSQERSDVVKLNILDFTDFDWDSIVVACRGATSIELEALLDPADVSRVELQSPGFSSAWWFMGSGGDVSRIEMFGQSPQFDTSVAACTPPRADFTPLPPFVYEISAEQPEIELQYTYEFGLWMLADK